jgi:hypothetical protein
MTIETTWTIEVGDLTSTVDFTDRVQGIYIEQGVDIGVVGRGSCQFTLVNADGALTPGGGGTYSSTDWFSKAVFITATVNDGSSTTVDVFHGLIVDFDLQDDGVFSTVRISAVDALSFVGATAAGYMNFFYPPPPFTANVNFYTSLLGLNLTNAFPEITFTEKITVFPVLGQTDSVAVPTALNDQQDGWDRPCQPLSGTFTTVGEMVQVGFVGVGDVLWSTTIEASGTDAEFSVLCMPYTTTRDDDTAHTFQFDEIGSVAGTRLPFDNTNFRQEYNTGTLITYANVNGETSSSNVNTYGSKAVYYGNTISKTTADAQEAADRYVNRYSTPRFLPSNLQVTAGQVRSFCASGAKSSWAKLLSISDGLWQKAEISWTGAGSDAQTQECIVKRRTIAVSPSDTVVNLTLGSWLDNHGFILNIDRLDQDRLG